VDGLTSLEIAGIVVSGAIVVALGGALAAWAWYGRKRRIAWRDIPVRVAQLRAVREQAATPVTVSAPKLSGGQVSTPRTEAAPQAPTPVHRNPVDNWSAGYGVVATDATTARTGSGAPPRGPSGNTPPGLAGRRASISGDATAWVWTSPPFKQNHTR
jgi:hypothetical protein